MVTLASSWPHYCELAVSPKTRVLLGDFFILSLTPGSNNHSLSCHFRFREGEILNITHPRGTVLSLFGLLESCTYFVDSPFVKFLPNYTVWLFYLFPTRIMTEKSFNKTLTYILRKILLSYQMIFSDKYVESTLILSTQ